MERLINLIKIAIDNLFIRTKLFARPYVIHLEINDQCNLNCIMCGRRVDWIPRDRGWLELTKIRNLESLIRSSMYVGIAGNGEPLLHPELSEILEYVISLGAIPSITTNGTLIDEKWANRFLNIGRIVLVISFDASSKETYESIRKGADFDALMDNLRRLNNLKKERSAHFPVMIFQVCLMKQNIGELEGIIKIARDLDIRQVSIQNLLAYNDEIKQFAIEDMVFVERRIGEAKKFGEKIGVNVVFVPIGIGAKKRGLMDGTNKKFICENAWRNFHVDTMGKVRFCCMWIDGNLGDITRDNIEQIWRSPEFANLRKRIKRGDLPENCQNCHGIVLPDHKKTLKLLYSDFKNVLKNKK